jgi:uncharacterized protein (TIGR04168 family)
MTNPQLPNSQLSILNSQFLRLAIVGDIHHQWDDTDHAALHGLGVDLVLFVGDYGNEAVDIVRQISQLALPKAAIMGNHDAWYSVTAKGKARCPYDRAQEDWVQAQLELLGDCHVGYGCKDFPDLGLSVVGARPFSWGGAKWKYSKFCKARLGVHGFAESAKRIATAIAAATGETILIIGHNGPAGLGDRPEDPCGKDWGELIDGQLAGGDYGDPDLAMAIAQAQAAGKSIPLVTFGHMHHRLKSGQPRRTQQQVGQTRYFNAACVPRWNTIDGEPVRHFGLVTLVNGQVEQASQAWVNQQGQIVAETTDPNSSTQIPDRQSEQIR